MNSATLPACVYCRIYDEKRKEKNKKIVSNMQTMEHTKQRMITIKIIILKEPFSNGELNTCRVPATEPAGASLSP
jgi:hypothetical protein